MGSRQTVFEAAGSNDGLRRLAYAWHERSIITISLQLTNAPASSALILTLLSVAGRRTQQRPPHSTRPNVTSIRVGLFSE